MEADGSSKKHAGNKDLSAYVFITTTSQEILDKFLKSWQNLFLLECDLLKKSHYYAEHLKKHPDYDMDKDDRKIEAIAHEMGDGELVRKIHIAEENIVNKFWSEPMNIELNKK